MQLLTNALMHIKYICILTSAHNIDISMQICFFSHFSPPEIEIFNNASMAQILLTEINILLLGHSL